MSNVSTAGAFLAIAPDLHGLVHPAELPGVPSPPADASDAMLDAAAPEIQSDEMQSTEMQSDDIKSDEMQSADGGLEIGDCVRVRIISLRTVEGRTYAGLSTCLRRLNPRLDAAAQLGVGDVVWGRVVSVRRATSRISLELGGRAAELRATNAFEGSAGSAGDAPRPKLRSGAATPPPPEQWSALDTPIPPPSRSPLVITPCCTPTLRTTVHGTDGGGGDASGGAQAPFSGDLRERLFVGDLLRLRVAALPSAPAERLQLTGRLPAEATSPPGPAGAMRRAAGLSLGAAAALGQRAAGGQANSSGWIGGDDGEVGGVVEGRGELGEKRAWESESGSEDESDGEEVEVAASASRGMRKRMRVAGPEAQ